MSRTEDWNWTKKSHMKTVCSLKFYFHPQNQDKHDSIFSESDQKLQTAFSFLNFLPFFDLIITIKP